MIELLQVATTSFTVMFRGVYWGSFANISIPGNPSQSIMFASVPSHLANVGQTDRLDPLISGGVLRGIPQAPISFARDLARGGVVGAGMNLSS